MNDGYENFEPCAAAMDWTGWNLTHPPETMRKIFEPSQREIRKAATAARHEAARAKKEFE